MNETKQENNSPISATILTEFYADQGSVGTVKAESMLDGRKRKVDLHGFNGLNSEIKY